MLFELLVPHHKAPETYLIGPLWARACLILGGVLLCGAGAAMATLGLVS